MQPQVEQPSSSEIRFTSDDSATYSSCPVPADMQELQTICSRMKCWCVDLRMMAERAAYFTFTSKNRVF